MRRLGSILQSPADVTRPSDQVRDGATRAASLVPATEAADSVGSLPQPSGAERPGAAHPIARAPRRWSLGPRPTDGGGARRTRTVSRTFTAAPVERAIDRVPRRRAIAPARGLDRPLRVPALALARCLPATHRVGTIARRDKSPRRSSMSLQRSSLRHERAAADHALVISRILGFPRARFASARIDLLDTTAEARRSSASAFPKSSTVARTLLPLNHVADAFTESSTLGALAVADGSC
jgi:hypothetical protein